LTITLVYKEMEGKSRDTEVNDIRKTTIDWGGLMKVSSKKNSRQIEEVLVHIFDFYHFYGSRGQEYIEYVWQSWAVQPSINDKLDEYIERTVTALAAARFEYDDFHVKAIGDFEQVLKIPSFREKIKSFVDKLDAKFADASYVDGLKSEILRSRFIISIFHAIFKSKALKHYCSIDPFSVRSPRYVKIKSKLKKTTSQRIEYQYPAKKGVFHSSNVPEVPQSFANPLLFLRDFSRDNDPNASISAWLFCQLAFNLQFDEINNEDE